MKKFISFCGAAIAALFLCGKVEAAAGGQIAVDQILSIPTAYSSTVSIRTDGMNWASAETVLTSGTVPAGTFNDGVAATGSLTVVSFAALSSATATGSLTVVSNSGLVGACVSGGGPNFGSFNTCDGNGWTRDLSASSQTACNLAASIASFNIVLATCGINGASVVYTTAPYGASTFNTFQINASTPALTIVQMSGGQDNQSFSINGQTFIANQNFSTTGSNTAVGTSIALAITNSSTTTGVRATSAAAGIVTTTATAVGVSTNYAMTSSSDTALKLSLPKTVTGSASVGAMTGGANAAWVINTSTISIANNGFTTGLQVLYATPTVAIGGLIGGTTYFVIDLPGTSPFELATTLANALAGTAIVLTSSGTPTTTDSYTLTPLGVSGAAATLKWVVSNDNANWIPFGTTSLGQTVLSVSQSTFTYVSTGTVNVFDFGHVDYGWLGLSFTDHPTGSVNVTAHIIGKQN